VNLRLSLFKDREGEAFLKALSGFKPFSKSSIIEQTNRLNQSLDKSKTKSNQFYKKAELTPITMRISPFTKSCLKQRTIQNIHTS
jgi:hypothetical protein